MMSTREGAPEAGEAEPRSVAGGAETAPGSLPSVLDRATGPGTDGASDGEPFVDDDENEEDERAARVAALPAGISEVPLVLLTLDPALQCRAKMNPEKGAQGLWTLPFPVDVPAEVSGG